MSQQSERVCFIFNPGADRNHSANKLRWLEESAGKLWENVDIKVTRYESELAAIAREMAFEADKIVACGGDGTISRVIGGVAESVPLSFPLFCRKDHATCSF